VAKLNTPQQCALVVMKANPMLSCTSKKISSRLREVITSHSLASERPHLECCAQFGTAQHERQMERLKRAQWKATKVVRGCSSWHIGGAEQS